MKGLTLLFMLIFCSVVSANTYYVAPNGLDSNPGTVDKPWKTWGKAFTSASAGDTVYFRGGVYPMSIAGGAGYTSINDGKLGSLIYYWAYPGEKPILDCGQIKTTTDLHFGIKATANYCHFKGLTVRNVWGVEQADECLGWQMSSSNTIMENCTVYNTHGFGFRAYANCSNLSFINCDTYNNCDSLRTQYPGNDGYGFAVWNTSGTTGSVYFYGCRAWNCGDDGFAFYSKSYVEVNNCWAFRNGQLEGGGHGFKLGFLPDPPYTTLLRKVTNSIATYNRAAGFTSNDNACDAVSMNVYNNTAYRNGFYSEWKLPVYGFYLYNTSYSDEEELKRVLKNNISYDNENGPVYIPTNSLYTHDHNSWDIPVTLSTADFVSLGSTDKENIELLSSERQPDGSLPDLKGFLKLKSTSKAVDVGTNVGLPYFGTAPDLGYSEYSGTVTTPSVPIYVSSAIENATPSKLEITYSLSLANIAPVASAFAVMVNSVARSISSVSITGTKVLLTLSSPVVYGEAVTVAYTKPSTNPLQTVSGGQAASVNSQSVTNRVAAPVPVYVSSVIENATPSRLEVTYSISLANIVPATSAFAVTVNSAIRSVSSVSISGTKVLLTLSSPVVYGNVVTVAYTKPSTNPLQTTAGGQAASLSAQSVTNSVTAPVNQSPFVSISSPSKNSSFISPATIIIEAVVSDPDGSIKRVEFFNGTIKLGERTSSPYSHIWKDVTKGTYSITAVATDNLNSTTASAAVSLTVINSIPTGNRQPKIKITKPNNGNKYVPSSTIEVTIDSYDPDSTISKVEYFLGTTKIGESITAPYSFSFESGGVGTYEIRAVACDKSSAIVSSALVNIYVTSNGENSELLTLFPNPNDGRFSIELFSPHLKEESIVTVVNTAGETVFKDILVNEEITKQFDLSYLRSGIYILMISSDEIIITKKFIKK